MDLHWTAERMTGEDLRAVSAIEQASFRDPWSLQSFQTEIETNPLAFYLVARREEKVIAYIGAWIVQDEVHITTLAVDVQYRRRGVALGLVKELISRVASSGACCLTLEVRPSNTAARRFYEKLGFVVLGRRKFYYADEDALIMTKNGLRLPEDLEERKKR